MNIVEEVLNCMNIVEEVLNCTILIMDYWKSISSTVIFGKSHLLMAAVESIKFE